MLLSISKQGQIFPLEAMVGTMVEKFGKLQGLKVRGRAVDGAMDLVPLKRLTKLRYLDLTCYRCTTEDLALVASLDGLTHLEFDGELEDADVKKLTSLTNLQYVGVGGSRITQQSLGFLAMIKALTGIRYCPSLEPEALQSLRCMPNLTKISFTSRGSVTDACARDLEAMTHLKSLNMSDCRSIRFTDFGLLHGLTELCLANCDHIDGTIFRGLGHLTALKRLHVKGVSSLNDSELKEWETLRSLQYLKLSYFSMRGREAKITDVGLATIMGLPALTHLVLKHCATIRGKGCLRQGYYLGRPLRASLVHLDLVWLPKNYR